MAVAQICMKPHFLLPDLLVFMSGTTLQQIKFMRISEKALVIFCKGPKFEVTDTPTLDLAEVVLPGSPKLFSAMFGVG